MNVTTASERVKSSRKMVFELLMADQPKRETSHDPDSKFWSWADSIGLSDSRFPVHGGPPQDASHTAMRVNLDHV